MEKKKNPIVLGHRGIRKGDVEENTISAFEEALNRGASGIEIDVESTSDGKLIVVNRWYLYSKLGFFPWEKPFKIIQNSAKEKGIEIPTFFETCEFIKKKERNHFQR